MQRTIVEPAGLPRPALSRLRRRPEPRRWQQTDRDQDIAVLLSGHGYLTGEQIRRLLSAKGQPRRFRGRLLTGPIQPRTIRARLRLLYDVGFLDRVAVVAQPTAGVPPYVYALTPDSAEVAAAKLGHPVPVPSTSHSSLRFFAHQVAVCNFFVSLTEASRGTDWAIGQWQHEWQLKVKDETGTRRSERIHVTDPDTKQELHLTVLPDAYFTLVKPGRTLHYFLELDRGTHRRRCWRERALAFTAYHRQGRFRQRFGGDHFRLLIVTSTEQKRVSRSDKLLGIIEETLRSTGDEETIDSTDLFLVTSTQDKAQLDPSTLLGPIWRQPGRPEGHSLLPASPRARPVARPLSA